MSDDTSTQDSKDFHDSNIPDDPRENLTKLRGVLGTFERRLESKEKALETQRAKRDKAQQQLDENDGSDEALVGRLQAIVDTFQYHVNGLKRDVRNQSGRVSWAKRQISGVEYAIECAEKRAPLSSQPFAEALDGVSVDDAEDSSEEPAAHAEASAE